MLLRYELTMQSKTLTQRQKSRQLFLLTVIQSIQAAAAGAYRYMFTICHTGPPLLGTHASSVHLIINYVDYCDSVKVAKMFTANSSLT